MAYMNLYSNRRTQREQQVKRDVHVHVRSARLKRLQTDASLKRNLKSMMAGQAVHRKIPLTKGGEQMTKRNTMENLTDVSIC